MSRSWCSQQVMMCLVSFGLHRLAAYVGIQKIYIKMKNHSLGNCTIWNSQNMGYRGTKHNIFNNFDKKNYLFYSFGKTQKLLQHDCVIIFI